MGGARQDIETHITRLHGNGRLRVWSLIITFLGDAVALRGGRVALGVLQDAMAMLGVEQGAVRTALSRLAKDGWVEREREGRLSFYELSSQGRFAFDEATRRIYAPGPPDWHGEWTIAITDADHAGTLAAHRFVPLGGSAWIKAGEEPDTLPADVLVIRGTGTDFPPGLIRLWSLQTLADQYNSFIANWTGFATDGLPPSSAIAARTLLIHDWRRIVLRDPGLPDALLPAGWPGHEALALIRQIYAGLAGASEQWLDEAGLPALSDRRKLMNRFIALQNIAD